MFYGQTYTFLLSVVHLQSWADGGEAQSQRSDHMCPGDYNKHSLREDSDGFGG